MDLRLASISLIMSWTRSMGITSIWENGIAMAWLLLWIEWIKHGTRLR
jgi:hypothetical protein